MKMLTLCLLLVLACSLTACAGKDVEIRPKGQMVIGGSVGN